MGPGKSHVQGVLSYQSSASADIRQDNGFSFLGPTDHFNPNSTLGRIRASTLLDLAAGYDWGRYNVELYASNVFDARNELSRFVSCNSSYCSNLHIVVGRPRTIGLRLGAHF
jgi:outer membrane receptor protein involved in Fe transport